jgi:hypothetical protein
MVVCLIVRQWARQNGIMFFGIKKESRLAGRPSITLCLQWCKNQPNGGAGMRFICRGINYQEMLRCQQ